MEFIGRVEGDNVGVNFDLVGPRFLQGAGSLPTSQYAVEQEEGQHTSQQEIPLAQRQQYDEDGDDEHVQPEDVARPV